MVLVKSWSWSLLCLLLMMGWWGGGMVEGGFPNGRCYVPRCNASPYELAVTRAERGKLCFRFDVRSGGECVEDAKYGCCAKFSGALQKVVLKTDPRCRGAFDMVTVDGVRKGGGVFFDVYDKEGEGELRITSMSYNTSTVVGKEFCVLMRGDMCADVSVFFNGSSLAYALFDPATHTCCPTCLADFGGSSSDSGSGSVYLYNPPIPRPNPVAKVVNSPPPMPSPVVKRPMPPPSPMAFVVNKPPIGIGGDKSDDLQLSCSCTCKSI